MENLEKFWYNWIGAHISKNYREVSDFSINKTYSESWNWKKKIAMSRMDLETPKEVVAPDDMTAADYYFDSYAHFGKDNLYLDNR